MISSWIRGWHPGFAVSLKSCWIWVCPPADCLLYVPEDLNHRDLITVVIMSLMITTGERCLSEGFIRPNSHRNMRSPQRKWLSFSMSSPMRCSQSYCSIPLRGWHSDIHECQFLLHRNSSSCRGKGLRSFYYIAAATSRHRSRYKQSNFPLKETGYVSHTAAICQYLVIVQSMVYVFGSLLKRARIGVIFKEIYRLDYSYWRLRFGSF